MSDSVRNCDKCGREYTFQRRTSKYCSQTCRNAAMMQRRRLGASAQPRPPRALQVVDDQAHVGATTLTEATLVELAAVGREATALGLAALALARRIDHAHGETGSALASMVKAHREALAAATADVAVEVDPLDEMRRRRDAKRAAH